MKRRIAEVVVSIALLGGCSAPVANENQSDEGAHVSVPPHDAETVDVSDNGGTKSVPLSPEDVVTLDARSDELVRALGAEPIAAFEGETPDLDAAKKATPQLVVMGAGHPVAAGDLEELEAATGAAVIDLSPREGKPLDWELVRQVQVLGKIFDKDDEAQQLDDDFSEALERASEAYQDSWKVAVVRANGAAITPLSPEESVLWEPVFTMVGMKGADIEGDPDFVVVEERDPRGARADFVPARKLLAEAYPDAAAIESGAVYVGPYSASDTASIITYTLLLNEMTELLSQWS